MGRRFLSLGAVIGFLLLGVAVLVTAISSSSSPAAGAAGVDRRYAEEMLRHADAAAELAEIADAAGPRPLAAAAAEHGETDLAEVEALRADALRLARDGAVRGDLGVDGGAPQRADGLTDVAAGRARDTLLVDSLVEHSVAALRLAVLQRDDGADPALVRSAERSIQRHEQALRQLDRTATGLFGRPSSVQRDVDPHQGMAGM